MYIVVKKILLITNAIKLYSNERDKGGSVVESYASSSSDIVQMVNKLAFFVITPWKSVFEAIKSE